MSFDPLLLFSIGILVGTVGTLVGAGGGFILVPVLLMLYPQMEPETITGVSLVVVFCNALSGSLAYIYKRNIDYKSAALFSLFAIPGSVLGVFLTKLVQRDYFEMGFGITMIFVSLVLFISPSIKSPLEAKPKKYPIRVITDRKGREYHISYNMPLGAVFSAIVGFLSSLLGIGGGVIHVPVMVKVFDFPPYIAIATSHLILAFSAFIGALIHLYTGSLATTSHQIAWLAPSVILGAQIGAHLSSKVNEFLIIRILAFVLIIVGIRFLF